MTVFAIRLSRGAKVTKEILGECFRGVVDLISPEANRQKATVQVRVKVIDPDDLLKPEMNATVSFLSPASGASSAPSAERPPIRVPASAVRDGAVFVVENGKAVKRISTPANR